MYFSSFSELLTMGGHGVFVWSSYLITFISIISIMAWAKYRRQQLKALLHELQQSPTPTPQQSALAGESDEARS